MQKVLHFIDSEGVYGAERVILNLSQKMLAQPEFIPVIGCIVSNTQAGNPLYDAALAAGIEAHKIVIANSKLLSHIPAAADQLKSLGISLIHSHGYKPSVFGFFIARRIGIPIISTCHLWFQPNQGPLKMRVMIWLEKKLYRHFPKIIAVSEPIKAILAQAKLPAHKLDLVRNGVDIPEVDLSSEAALALRAELGLAPDDLVILNSGRLARQKAQWILVKAASILQQQGRKIQMLIVGEGGLRSELEALIEQEGVGSCVKLLGFRSDINQLLAISDIFALPSLDEGMPMSLLEAAAAAKPIIATAVGDIAKLIRHDDSGLIIPTENPQALSEAIVKLVDDTAFAQRLANTAYRLMRADYSSDAMCSRYQTIYRELIKA
jgi:glycosyltransferase involved in cell wall biosynthesis